MTLDNKLDMQVILDGLGQGVLIFNKDGSLTMDNIAARTMLGTDLNVIRSEGWSAASVLFNTGLQNPDDKVEVIRNNALETERPVRFHIYRSGNYTPCWAAGVTASDGDVYLMITLDTPDWTAVTEMVDRFRSEMHETIDAAKGHLALISATIKKHKDADSGEELGKRINNFSRLIAIDMERTGRLMEMLERLEDLRTGKVRDVIRQRRRKIKLDDFFEDFAEELDEIKLLDPETQEQDIRSRVEITAAAEAVVHASSRYLTRILHDMLRNAIMYSLKATPIKINVHVKQQNVQIDMTDEGYGIRSTESDRVFTPFQRARQPQIIGEFGYGLSLYLCKHEVEAMQGRMWFESEEGVGTTFSVMLPMWHEDASSSSQSET